MPFSLLLMVYALFAFLFYDRFEILPLSVGLITGIVCGYWDYSRYLINRNLAPVVFILTIILCSSIFILHLDFNILIVVAMFLALGIGAIISIVFHSSSAIERNEVEAGQAQQLLMEYNQRLTTEKDTLHIALSDGEKREAALRSVMERNSQAITDLNNKNNELSLYNRRLKVNLDNISNQKKNRESELLSLAENTLSLENTLRENSQIKKELDRVKEGLLRKEKELNQKIARNVDNTHEVTNNLKKELNYTKNELEKNELEKVFNARNLKEARLVLATQAQEKHDLEEQIKNILREQNALRVSIEDLRIEKETVQEKLSTIQNEINIHKETNLKSEQTIKELSLTNQELSIKDNFLNKWIEIELLLKERAYPSKASNSAALIQDYYDFGKIDIHLKESLHCLRGKRNDISHNLNAKISASDVKQVNECYDKLIRKLI